MDLLNLAIEMEAEGSLEERRSTIPAVVHRRSPEDEVMRKHNIVFEARDTTESVKSIIAIKFCLTKDENVLSLFCDGKEMKDGKTIDDYAHWGVNDPEDPGGLAFVTFSTHRRSNRAKQPKKYFPMELADSASDDDGSILSSKRSCQSILSTSSSNDSSSLEHANDDDDNSATSVCVSSTSQSNGIPNSIKMVETGGRVKTKVEEKRLLQVSNYVFFKTVI